MTDKPEAEHSTRSPILRLRVLLRELYLGSTHRAVRFRLWVILLDLVLIGFFIVTPMLREHAAYLFLDYVIAAIVGVDLAARTWVARDLKRWLLRPGFLIDVVVLLTLLFPLTLANFAFLRVLRLSSLIHSEFFWQTVARRYNDSRWEDTVKAVATFVTFLFVVTGFVYALYARRHPDINGYVDALYFTVTTVTTTGFGDVTLPGDTGKLISIAIMVSGISLFVRLAQAIVRPAKVRFPCPTCGLIRHDLDAVHCKACGTLLNIPNED